MLENHTPRQNRLLAALPAATFQRLESDLELVSLAVGDVLHDSNSCLQHVYFPTTSIVAKVSATSNGTCAEFAVVGNEGIVGIALFLGGDSTPSQSLLVSAGHAYRLKKEALNDELNRDSTLMHLLLRYTHTLMMQAAQSGVCNRHHSVEQQLSRWLLQSIDRLASNEVAMTHELIASMLGVRREGITEAACKLQRTGLIHYRRGHIAVLDRIGLEAHACECYAVLKKAFDGLLLDPIASTCTSSSVLATYSYSHLRQARQQSQLNYSPS